MKAIHQLATFQNIYAQYQQDQPLQRFLVAFYKQNKQMGSRDRKIATKLLYNYFRIGDLLKDEIPENRLIVAEFLCNEQSSSFLAHFKSDWDANIQLAVTDKIEIIKKEYPAFELKAIFSFNEHLSDGINHNEFYLSLLMQPDLYIRMKRGSEAKIQKLLEEAGIQFNAINSQTLALPNGTKLDSILLDKGSYEVQDISSQKVGSYFKPQKWDKWWDCCAASGGKSLLLHDEQPDIKLLVTDNRESILTNLTERFALAGIRDYQKKILDLTQNPDLLLHDYAFDGIILDAPCSGSGTWGRTPEMIAQFKDYKIKFFTELQRKIAANVIKYLKPQKPLIYITCSVFREENEEQVAWLIKNFDLTLESIELLKGYNSKADTMFVARLIKNN
jgi:16S rRNA (cytosine967-C5)-methyltransferase